MKKKIERKKIKAAAATMTVVLSLTIVGLVPGIIADTQEPLKVYDGPVTVYLNASDNYSGVAGIYWALDPVQVTPDDPIDYNYNESDQVVLYVDKPGNHTVHYYAVDNIGNAETPKTKSFVIYKDDIAPKTTVYIEGKLYQP